LTSWETERRCGRQLHRSEVGKNTSRAIGRRGKLVNMLCRYRGERKLWSVVNGLAWRTRRSATAPGLKDLQRQRRSAAAHQGLLASQVCGCSGCQLRAAHGRAGRINRCPRGCRCVCWEYTVGNAASAERDAANEQERQHEGKTACGTDAATDGSESGRRRRPGSGDELFSGVGSERQGVGSVGRLDAGALRQRQSKPRPRHQQGRQRHVRP
jgi:hypothetical protein